MTYEFSNMISQSDLDELDVLLKEQYCLEPDETYYNSNHGHESSPNGGSLWPEVIKLNSKSSPEIIEMLNTLSLRCYEEHFVGTDEEEFIGTEECYDQWLESNYHYYSESDSIDCDYYDHEDVIDSIRFVSKTISADVEEVT
jgi:hypothetical protein